MTISASPDQRMRSGRDDLHLSAMRVLLPCGLAQLGGLGLGRLGAADVQERLLGQVVEVAVDEGLEAVDGLLDRGGDARRGR